MPSNLLRLVAALVLFVLVLGAAAWRQRPDGRLHVLFLPTKGDAVLLQTPAGRFVLLDGGGDPAALATLIGRRLPYWRRSLDAVVLTLPDSGRLPGQLAALTRYRAGIAFAPPALPRSAGAREWRRLLDEQRTPLRAARVGDRIALDGVALTVLALGDGDEAGMVLKVEYGRTSVLLDGAGGESDEDALLRGARRVDALAYPWQRPLPGPLLEAWRPRSIIFTEAYEADRPVLLTTFERAVGGAAVYHERLHGAIELISDGRRLWVETDL
jgi:beta-lactamase superfamily II metal-dependent hydrolase